MDPLTLEPARNACRAGCVAAVEALLQGSDVQQSLFRVPGPGASRLSKTAYDS
jgi:hypothetical protein